MRIWVGWLILDLLIIVQLRTYIAVPIRVGWLTADPEGLIVSLTLGAEIKQPTNLKIRIWVGWLILDVLKIV
jgi:hypothetical protein